MERVASMVADNLAMPAQLHWPGQPYKKGLIHACTFEIGNGPTGRLIPEWLLATAPPGHDRERMQADLREAVEPAAPHRCLDARPRSQRDRRWLRGPIQLKARSQPPRPRWWCPQTRSRLRWPDELRVVATVSVEICRDPQHWRRCGEAANSLNPKP